MLIRELKRDSELDDENNAFKDMCELVDKISEICLRQERTDNINTSVISDLKDHNKKASTGINKKQKKKDQKDQPKGTTDSKIEYTIAKEQETHLVMLQDRVSRFEVLLKDKDLDVDDLKTRLDVLGVNNKQDKEQQKTKLKSANSEVRDLKEKLDHALREVEKIRSTYVSPKEFQYTQQELTHKVEEIVKYKLEINRQKDVINTFKHEKIGNMRMVSDFEVNAKSYQKQTDEITRLKSEISRKEKSIQNIRILNEELKTDKEMKYDQNKQLEDRVRSLKQDVDRKDKIIWEWKSKQDNIVERSSLEISEGESRSKECERQQERIKKMKADIDRKDMTIESYKHKLSKFEDTSSTFNAEWKEKHSILSKDLNDLNRKADSQLKALRKTEVNATALKSVILTVFKSFKDKIEDLGSSVNLRSQFNHSEAMKLLELNEDELNMFINTTSENSDELGLVKLLEKNTVECERVTGILIDRVNKYIELEVDSTNRQSQVDYVKKENIVRKK